MVKDYRDGQKVIATIEIEDQGQDFIELDVLENGVIVGDNTMFSYGRVSLLGIGTENGMEYHDFKEFAAMKKWQLKGLTIYTFNTGTKTPLPWNATTLKYRVTKVKKAVKSNRFIKK